MKSKLIRNIFLDFVIFFVAAPIMVFSATYIIRSIGNYVLLEKAFLTTLVIFFLGIILNRLVFYANGLKIVIRPEDYKKYAFYLKGDYCCMSEKTKLNILGDRISIGPRYCVSIGDILIWLGAVSSFFFLGFIIIILLIMDQFIGPIF